MTEKGRTVWRVIILVILVLVIIFSLGTAIALSGRTLIPIWIPIVGSLALGVISGVTLHMLWPPLTGINKRWVNYIIHIIASTIIFLGLFYILNTFVVRGEPKEEKVIVLGRHTETHYHTKRVGRRSYAKGSPYKVYFITGKFPDGKTRDLEIRSSQYVDLRRGDTIPMKIMKGLFGVKVADMDFEVPKRRHCRRVGPSGRSGHRPYTRNINTDSMRREMVRSIEERKERLEKERQRIRERRERILSE